MKDPSTPEANQGSRPDIVLNYGPRRLAAWLNENERGDNPKIELSNAYRNSDGQWIETKLIGVNDLLPFARLFERMNDSIEERRQDRRQERSNSQEPLAEISARSETWHDDDKRRDEIKRERFKDDRKPSRGTRRAKPRDRAAR